MDVGFGVIDKGKHVEFQRFSSNAKRMQSLIPLFQADNESAILMGRVYYRNDCMTALDRSRDKLLIENAQVNDAALAIALYRQLGEEGLNKLEGDYSLVIFDRLKMKIVGSRDPMGGYPLFWVNTNGQIAFSTSIRQLLPMLPHHNLCLEYISEYLTAPSPFNELDSESCAFEGIHRVLSGSIAVASLQTKEVQQRRYWDWNASISAIDPQSIAHDYKKGLIVAVEERMKGRTCSHLSGGMDSTAVTLIANNLIANDRLHRPLQAISLVYSKLEELAQETPYLEIALQNQRGLDTHYVPADELLDFDSFFNPPNHEEPYSSLWRLALDKATIDCAVENDADTLLTGIGADEMLDMQPFHLTDLLRSGRFRQAWTEATSWASADNCNPWEVLNIFGIANIISSSSVVSSFRCKLGGNRGNQDFNAVPSWIMPDFAERFDLKNRAIAKTRNVVCGYHRSTPLSVALSSINSRIGDFNRWTIAAPHGVVITHPFLDPRMLSLGLGIIAKIKPKSGTMKPILAEAMREILPGEIRNRRRKGHFNEVYYRGLSNNLKHLEALINKPDVKDLDLFNRQELANGLQQASLGGVGVRACQHLNFSLSLIRWYIMINKESHKSQPINDIVKISTR